MDIIDQVANEVKWLYKQGIIADTKTETVIDIAQGMFPDIDWEHNLIFQVMMKI